MRTTRGVFAHSTVLVLAVCLAGVPAAAQKKAPPNILLIVADDVGAEASGLYPFAGETGAAPTPNLDKLAAKGLVFDNTWVNPMCSPTRSTLLTGLYGHHTGVLVAGDVLDTSTRTIFDLIAKESPAKYDMAVFGKWHLGGNRGDIKHVMDMRVPNYKGFLGAQVTDYFNWTAWDGDTGASSQVTTYTTTTLTDWAVDFIKKHEASRPQDPWFVYVPYNAAHAPFQVPPANLVPGGIGELQAGSRSPTVAVYKKIIQALDTEVGRLLQNVDLTRTLVIYLGDNGTPANVKDKGAGVRGSKTSTYEGGARVPLVASGVGVTRTGREKALVNGTDIFATIAAAAGIPVTHVNDGYNLVPLFSDAKASSGRKYGLTEFCSGQVARFALRDNKYKLFFDNADGWALFDLLDDPSEKNNVYDKPGVAAAQKELSAELARMKASATKGCFR